MSKIPNAFVTIITFYDSTKAHICKSLLESEGIHCFLRDELLNQLHPGTTFGSGGVKLQVRQRDIYQAKKILQYGGYFEEGIVVSDDLLTVIERVTNQLPFIGGWHVIWRIVSIALLVGIVFIFIFLSEEIR